MQLTDRFSLLPGPRRSSSPSRSSSSLGSAGSTALDNF
jgi:hypothetical protein